MADKDAFDCVHVGVGARPGFLTSVGFRVQSLGNPPQIGIVLPNSMHGLMFSCALLVL